MDIAGTSNGFDGNFVVLRDGPATESDDVAVLRDDSPMEAEELFLREDFSTEAELEELLLREEEDVFEYVLEEPRSALIKKNNLKK